MISKTAKLVTLLCVAALAAAALPIAGLAASKPGLPRVQTGAAQHVLGTSALLAGVVEPNGADTSYYFQWGTTTAYGNFTPTVHIGPGSATNPKVKVGQEVKGLVQGSIYHFRLIAVYTGPKGPASVIGRDHAFTAKATPLKFEMPKGMKEPVGSTFLLSGALRGFGGAHHAIALQATAYPYTAPFTTIAAPSTTDANGRFFFRVAHFTSSTEFRVITLDTKPFYSPTVTVRAEVLVVLHVRKSSQPGLVRLYGTVTPAQAGAPVQIQLDKALKHPRSEEHTTAFVTQFSSVVKKATRSFSRFSLIVKIVRGGSYRAFVKVKAGGPLISGASRSIVLKAGPKKKKKK